VRADHFLVFGGVADIAHLGEDAEVTRERIFAG